MLEDFARDFEAFSGNWWTYFIPFCVTVIGFIRVYAGGPYYQGKERMDGKLVIITGSSSGIGFETAKDLASRGAHIIMAVRNAEKGKRALEKIKENYKKSQVTVKLLDISEMDSIRNFVDQIEVEYEKIDVLINNAAVIHQPYTKTIDGNELTIATNYLGPFFLTHLLLPMLNKSEHGRIINVSAMAHFNGKLKVEALNMNKDNYNEADAYSQSKLALTIFTKYLATLLNKNTTITCNAVSPGLVRGTAHLQNLPLLKSAWTRFSTWPWVWLCLKTPKQGCQTILHVALNSNLKKTSGFYFSDCDFKEPAELLKDIHVAKALYKTSCGLVKIDGDDIINKLGNETFFLADERVEGLDENLKGLDKQVEGPGEKSEYLNEKDEYPNDF
ncbi:unnamed protein product [Ceutorhynchus assimilis]|uniref:Retinol dehydrogenase 13 n=1 Tax=Ceutorhynchus assimilis TaxID=467358 RepID=A0A9N9MK30_9CUCU|nr:unnamed protein product [Ceutorhynchus assimilis]